MSKKFGTNTKSAEARARQDAVKQANDRDKKQKLEDEYWRDDDKHVQKKQQRKNDQEQKEQEKSQKKQEIQRLLEQEEAALTASKAKAKPDLAPKKVTQAQIQQRQAAAAAAPPVQNEKPKRTNLDDEEIPIEENVNRLQIDGDAARNVDDAIQVLQSSQISLDRHPEKRMKAAYDAYETENLPKLKQEHPSLRLSQLKQLMKKEWMKAPENPFNKPTKGYNEGSISKQNTLPEQSDSDGEDN